MSERGQRTYRIKIPLFAGDLKFNEADPDPSAIRAAYATAINSHLGLTAHPSWFEPGDEPGSDEQRNALRGPMVSLSVVIDGSLLDAIARVTNRPVLPQELVRASLHVTSADVRYTTRKRLTFGYYRKKQGGDREWDWCVELSLQISDEGEVYRKSSIASAILFQLQISVTRTTADGEDLGLLVPLSEQTPADERFSETVPAPLTWQSPITFRFSASRTFTIEQWFSQARPMYGELWKPAVLMERLIERANVRKDVGEDRDPTGFTLSADLPSDLASAAAMRLKQCDAIVFTELAEQEWRKLTNELLAAETTGWTLVEPSDEGGATLELQETEWSDA